MKIISIKHTAQILNISVATVRNWIRHNYLKPLDNRKFEFNENAVIALKHKIESGQIDRLKKRANKKNSNISFIPNEYLNDIAFVNEVKKIKDIFKTNDLDLQTSIFVLALKQLVLSDEVIFQQESNVLKLESYSNWKRISVKEELYSWNRDLKFDESANTDAFREIFETLIDINHDDTIGIIYQSLLLEGSKSKQGSYYTPKDLVDDVFNKFNKCNGKYLDPCCGTGQFLLGAIDSGYSNPEFLFGFDQDEIAVKIARLNLFMAFKEIEFQPQIHHVNTLTDTFKNSFHLIATNPPWGSTLNVKESKSCKLIFPQIISGESFSLFLLKCIQISGKKGIISFILPESILNVKIHSDIREHLLKYTTVNSIYCLGKKFKGVFTSAVRLDLINATPPEGWGVDVYFKNGEHFQIPQSRFTINDNFVFDVLLSNEDLQILKLLYNKPHKTLKNNADWALGIVTGNNKKFVKNRLEKGMEPIYKGSNITKYHIRNPDSFIKYKPELFQQVAPEEKYRVSKKLIYKFISNKLVFAYDTSGSLTLNSANILLPKLENYSIKIILGLLNSKLYQFIFSKKFNTLKVLKGDLEKLPFPEFTQKEKSKIISYVDRVLEGENIQEKLDLEIMNILGLSQKQVDTVMNYDCSNNNK